MGRRDMDGARQRSVVAWQSEMDIIQYIKALQYHNIVNIIQFQFLYSQPNIFCHYALTLYIHFPHF